MERAKKVDDDGHFNLPYETAYTLGKSKPESLSINKTFPVQPQPDSGRFSLSHNAYAYVS